MLFELHKDLPREGPGDDAATARALHLLHLPRRPDILDVGCGPGAQTLVLAKETGGTIIAIDTHEPYLDEVRRRARLAGLGDRIQAMCASMEALPFASNSFDLIWAEGAIYIMGFEGGLLAWFPLVRPGGYVVVSELTWLAPDAPDEARRFWNEGYPAMASLEQNRATIQRSGYHAVADFVLPRPAWFDEYYDPLEARITTLAELHAGHAEWLRFLEEQRAEIDIVRRFGDSFGYVFYIAQRPSPTPKVSS